MLSWLKGIALALVTALVVAFGLGFYHFATTVERANAPSPLPEADAIVALTGGPPNRLTAGMDLLERGRGRRLLISGVDPKVTDQDVLSLLEGPPELLSCCVDLGRQAEDTLGNASETAAWAKRNSFSRLIVVTDDYHMPRSLVELQLAMPDAALIGYPIKTSTTRSGAWRSDLGAAGRIGNEYLKYLVIRLRAAVLKPQPKAPKQQPAA
jgi:uncharacterized SAM-binding protein YcdF (DUF218 family)